MYNEIQKIQHELEHIENSRDRSTIYFLLSETYRIKGDEKNSNACWMFGFIEEMKAFIKEHKYE